MTRKGLRDVHIASSSSTMKGGRSGYRLHRRGDAERYQVLTIMLM